MISNNFIEKEIHLISYTNQTIFDFTISAIKVIEISDCIIVDKNINKTLLNQIKSINNNLIFEDSLKLGKNNLWKNIFLLFQKSKKITHLKNCDSFFPDDLIDEYNFLKKKKCNVVIHSGLVDIIDVLNDAQIMLTDRRKNSSVYFLKASKFKNINTKKVNFEKIVIKVSQTNEFKDILEKLNKLNKFFRIIYICSHTKKIFFNQLSFKQFIKKKINFTDVYILMEKNATF